MVSPEKKLKKTLLILGIAGAVYLGIRFLLPLVIPFLCAYGTALWLRPSVRYLECRWQWSFRGKMRHVPVALIGTLEILVILAIAAGGLYFCGSQLIAQFERFTTSIPQLLVWLDVKLTALCRGIEGILGMKHDYLVASVREMIRELSTIVRESTMPVIMDNSISILAGLGEMLVFLVIFFLSTLMFLQEMDDIRQRKSNSMFHREFAVIGRRLVKVGSAWLKTELIIMSITAGLCTVGLFLIGNDYALLFGVGIGIVDALPFFGSGVILVPWGVVQLIQKEWLDAAVLLALYVVCYFTRQVLEAKIMGNRMGLSPMETIASMYVGIQLFGLVGFLLGPIALLLVEDLVDLYWEEERLDIRSDGS